MEYLGLGPVGVIHVQHALHDVDGAIKLQQAVTTHEQGGVLQGGAQEAQQDAQLRNEPLQVNEKQLYQQVDEADDTKQHSDHTNATARARQDMRKDMELYKTRQARLGRRLISLPHVFMSASIGPLYDLYLICPLCTLIK